MHSFWGESGVYQSQGCLSFNSTANSRDWHEWAEYWGPRTAEHHSLMGTKKVKMYEFCTFFLGVTLVPGEILTIFALYYEGFIGPVYVFNLSKINVCILIL